MARVTGLDLDVASVKFSGEKTPVFLHANVSGIEKVKLKGKEECGYVFIVTEGVQVPNQERDGANFKERAKEWCLWTPEDGVFCYSPKWLVERIHEQSRMLTTRYVVEDESRRLLRVEIFPFTNKELISVTGLNSAKLFL